MTILSHSKANKNTLFGARKPIPNNGTVFAFPNYRYRLPQCGKDFVMNPTNDNKQDFQSSIRDLGVSLLFVVAAFVLATAIGPPSWKKNSSSKEDASAVMLPEKRIAPPSVMPASIRLGHRSH